jgi:hypothetical protein
LGLISLRSTCRGTSISVSGPRSGALLLLALVAPARGQAWQAEAHAVPYPPSIDGVLDEAFWSTIDPITGFRQRDPVDGAPASERTEVRIAYDENGLYFGMTMHDSEPHLILRNILQRGGWIDKDDNILIALDTYHDGRNAYLFEIGALGTQDDALITDESGQDWNWDGIYHTEARVTEGGWVLEVAIPFTTIRFDDASAPLMGIAISRSIRRKNEAVYWPHIGQEYRAGIRQVSQYATLTGLRNLRKARHLEIKPYAIAGTSKVSDGDWDGTSDVGLDVKAAVSSNLAVDLTWNTDFAQVEADNVQINLTRFSLFFPEKREFFLERAGLFQFGAPRETEVFFSRQVGLDADIVGGGRVTGQVGPLSIGALSLRTDGVPGVIPEGGVPAAWSSVARLQGSVMPRTTLGGIVTSKESAGGHNRVAGVDFLTRFWSSSSLFLWGAKVWDSELAPVGPSRTAGQAELVLQNDRYLFEITRTHIGDAFEPALGFVPRPDQERWGGQVQFQPRFERSSWARQLFLNVAANHITGVEGRKQSHLRRLSGSLNLQSGDNFAVNVSERFERLEVADFINGRALPAGDYTFRSASLDFRPDRAREVGLNAGVSLGEFWSGTRTRLEAGVVWKMNRYLTIDGDVSWNDVSLPVPDGEFSTTLVSTRLEAAASRKLFAYALIQWDDVSNTLQSNIRVDWIHTPGSDLFVVLDTGYLTGPLTQPTEPRWTRRTGVIKLTYLRAF